MARIRGRRRREGGQGDRGATLVEFALIVPLLFTILFGIIEFGRVYENDIVLRQGVREAARQGVIANFGSTTSCNLHSPSGSSDMQKLMCLAKNRIGMDSSSLYVDIVFDTSYASGQGLLVCAMSPMQSVTGFFDSALSGKYYESKVEMNIESTSGSTETAGSETLPTGASWSWCTASTASP